MMATYVQGLEATVTRLEHENARLRGELDQLIAAATEGKQIAMLLDAKRRAEQDANYQKNLLRAAYNCGECATGYKFEGLGPALYIEKVDGVWKMRVERMIDYWPDTYPTFRAALAAAGCQARMPLPPGSCAAGSS